MTISPFPLCEARGLLVETEKGQRVRWQDILAALNEIERKAFTRQCENFALDMHLLEPSEIEQFLSTLTPEAPMAKKKAKAAKSKVTATVTKSAGAESTTAPLPTMEDIDKKIPAIETAIKKIIDWKAARLTLKEDIDSELSKLPGLFKKHGVDRYKAHGRSVAIEHGADIVKIKKVKES